MVFEYSEEKRQELISEGKMDFTLIIEMIEQGNILDIKQNKVKGERVSKSLYSGISRLYTGSPFRGNFRENLSKNELSIKKTDQTLSFKIIKNAEKRLPIDFGGACNGKGIRSLCISS